MAAAVSLLGLGQVERVEAGLRAEIGRWPDSGSSKLVAGAVYNQQYMEHKLPGHIEAVVAAVMLVERLAKVPQQAPRASPSVNLGHTRQVHVLPVDRCSPVPRADTLMTSEVLQDDQKAP